MNKNDIVIENSKSKNNLPEGIRSKANGTYSCRINVKGADGKWHNIEKSGFRAVREAQTARTLLQAEYIKDPALIDKKECKLTVTELYEEFISKEATFDREKSTLARYARLQHNYVDPQWGK